MEKLISDFVKKSLSEDVGTGDITSMACIPISKKGQAHLIAKEPCYVSGINIAKYIYQIYDSSLKLNTKIDDGQKVQKNDVIFTISGSQHSILATERLVLNCMQRMSAITTKTRLFVDKIKELNTIILDTRKTSPSLRFLEKEAVKIGGGCNHRWGLYDEIMIKDNHIDFAGGIKNAIKNCKNYLQKRGRKINIIIEARNIQEVESILLCGGVNRILLDNFTIPATNNAVKLVNGQYPLESSGNININNVRDYALCGVEFISVGCLTHSVKSTDLSMISI